MNWVAITTVSPPTSKQGLSVRAGAGAMDCGCIDNKRRAGRMGEIGVEFWHDVLTQMLA